MSLQEITTGMALSPQLMAQTCSITQGCQGQGEGKDKGERDKYEERAGDKGQDIRVRRGRR